MKASRNAAPPLKARLVNRLARSTGPVNLLRARRYGLDFLSGRPAAVEFYYEPGDPHSHLAAQLLPLLHEHLRSTLTVYIVLQEESPIYPEIERQRRFALSDAQRIAPAFGLNMPSSGEPVPADQRFEACRALLPCTGRVTEFVAAEREIAGRLFAGKPASTDDALDPLSTRDRLAANAARRARLGHYLPAMWQFNGEWFWGVDRFALLLERLTAAGLYTGPACPIALDPARATLPELPATPPPFEFFFSFRSPYSYLAAVQLQRMERNGPLQIKPVLPMAMRGFRVPAAKRLYILRDTCREADRLGIPFGHVCDPIGDGALRCLRVFPLARSSGQQLAFLVSAASAAWAEGVDLATDAGLRFACERAGLDWGAARERLADGDIGYAERNREELFAAGFWGVPSFRMGPFATWGRDRLWMIEELMRRHDRARQP